MPECDNCGGHVTDQYHRVFSANDGTLYGCSECRDNAEMYNGAGAALPDDE